MNRTIAWLALAAVLVGCAGVGPQPSRERGDQVLVRYDSRHHPVLANAGMVVTQNRIATQVGRDVLLDGGNAVDAAVAAGFALAVTLPRAGNIGGSGFMLLHLADEQRQVALDFRSAMPASFDVQRYLDANGRVDRNRLKFGAEAAGVPGTVAGLYEAWRRFGRLPFARLVQPAVNLARDGIKVSYDLNFALKAEREVFSLYPASAAMYLDADGRVPTAGATWRQPALADTLEAIRDGGADTFYRGALAERLVKAIQADGGYISLADLSGYRVQERRPLSLPYRDRLVVSMPPVSGGGITLLQMLGVLEHFDIARQPQGSAASLHLLAEIMKQGAANRRFGIGDPDFSDIEVARMLDPQLLHNMARQIDLDRARPVSEVAPMNPEDPAARSTTHVSVVDGDGNAVSLTYTLGYSFGSGYVAGDTGVLLDNQMRNFTYGQIGHANAPAPGKRMMSTMTPTFVLNGDGELELVTGTPGGSRIVNVVLQLLVNFIDYEFNVAAATAAPRIHQPWRSQALTIEPGISADTVELLRQLGHIVEEQDTMGSTQSIHVAAGVFGGAADGRRPDAAAAGVQRSRGRLVPGEATNN